MTQSLILAICMSFLFVRIHFLMKFVIGLIIVGAYSWIIFIEYSFIYEACVNYFTYYTNFIPNSFNTVTGKLFYKH